MTALDVLRAIRDLPDLTVNEYAVLTALELRADDNLSCWPSYEIIASDAHVSVSTAKRAIASLRRAGHVRVERRPVKGKREFESNRYYLKVVSNRHHLVSEGHEVVSHGHDGGVSETRQVVSEGHEGGVTLTQELPNERPNGTAHRRESAHDGSRTGRGRRKPQKAAPASDASVDKGRDWCDRWGIPHPDSDAVAARFLDHARANDRRAADWGAAWRTWKSREAEFGVARTIPRRDVQQAPATRRLWKVGKGT